MTRPSRNDETDCSVLDTAEAYTPRALQSNSGRRFCSFVPVPVAARPTCHGTVIGHLFPFQDRSQRLLGFLSTQSQSFVSSLSKRKSGSSAHSSSSGLSSSGLSSSGLSQNPHASGQYFESFFFLYFLSQRELFLPTQSQSFLFFLKKKSGSSAHSSSSGLSSSGLSSSGLSSSCGGGVGVGGMSPSSTNESTESKVLSQLPGTA